MDVMLYWDSSAIVSFLVGEPSADRVRAFLGQVSQIPSYSGIITIVEVESAIRRRVYDKSITLEQATQARIEMMNFREQTIFIPTDESVIEIALHCQRSYGLRVGDAIQLASARVGVQKASQAKFLCLDKRLNEAAIQEGFTVCLPGNAS